MVKQPKQRCFKKIATSFNAKSDLRVSADQCARKWAKLEAKLKSQIIKTKVEIATRSGSITLLIALP